MFVQYTSTYTIIPAHQNRPQSTANPRQQLIQVPRNRYQALGINIIVTASAAWSAYQEMAEKVQHLHRRLQLFCYTC